MNKIIKRNHKDKVLTISIAFIFVATLLFKTRAYNISTSLNISPEDVEVGQIISLHQNSYVLSNIEYDPGVYGVITTNPKMALVDSSTDANALVMNTGSTQILVSALNGDISQGDYITTSTLEGVGMKATESGSVIGRAMENYAPTNKDEQGLIMADLNIRDVAISNNTKNLLNVIKSGATGATLSPLDSLRYLLASALIFIAFILGISSFTKIAVNSVQALGRNPFAKDEVIKETYSSFALTAGLIVLGIVMAWIILSI